MIIKAVGFDIDGTLYPNLSMYLLTSPSFIMHPRLVYHYGKVRKEIRRMEYNGEFKKVQAKLLASSMKISMEKAGALIEKHLYEKWEYSFKSVKPFKDVRPSLLSLKREGLRLGAMSDFPVQRKLDFLGLADLMDIAFSSEDTGHLKPHSAPFKYLIKTFALKPEEILYVGNSYKYDVLGAKNAGLRTAHLTKKQVAGSEADFSFYSFSKLRDWIFTQNKEAQEE